MSLQQFFAIANILALHITICRADNPTGLIETLTGASVTDYLQLQALADIRVGGWATVGFTFNADHPHNKSNSPVAFNDRSNEFNLHQLNLYLEKPITADGHFALGGRFDFMFGTDSPYTQATGHWDDNLVDTNSFRLYDIALPQAYLEISLPGITGLSAKLGHFYGIIGYESVGSPGNFFYSHSYSMKSSPFTHTGALFAYAVNEALTLYSGAVTGADNFDKNLGAWSYNAGWNWTLNDKESGWQFAILHGDASETFSDTRTYLSTIWRQKLYDKLHLVLQHDHGWQDNAFGVGTPAAEWYSVVGYLSYDLADKLGVGIRGEWFSDPNGQRYNLKDADYYAVSLGLNWKPSTWLMLRPEVRMDWANSALPAYVYNTQNHQFLAGMDAVILF